MKKKYLEPTTETAPLFLSAGIMSGIGGSGMGGDQQEHGSTIGDGRG